MTIGVAPEEQGVGLDTRGLDAWDSRLKSKKSRKRLRFRTVGRVKHAYPVSCQDNEEYCNVATWANGENFSGQFISIGALG